MACSYIIVGAGNFGAAAALALIREDPEATILLVDTTPYPNPRAASHDINKIIRPDYADPTYMGLMAEAMPHWRTSPLYAPFYHEVGVMRIDPSDFPHRCVQSYRAMVGKGRKLPAEWMAVSDARALRGGVLQDADFRGVDKVLWNAGSGWAAADQALEAVIKAAIHAGVMYCSAGVKRLCIDDSGRCTGVVLGDGEVLTSERVLLCTGARTAAILADSAPDSEKIQAGRRLIATGAVSFYVRVAEEATKLLSRAPVVKSSLPQWKGESLGMTPDGILKFNCDISFTNMTVHPATGKAMSIPPEGDCYNSWTSGAFPEVLKDRAKRVLKGTYGRLVDGLPIEEYRICWDATTPTHDFLICPHPHCDNLFIASGGSFHGWKFLPVIGQYIVRMLRGTLDESVARRWSWDGPGDGSKAMPSYQIEADLRDLTSGH